MSIIDALDTRTETAVRFRARHCIYALPRFTAPHVIEGYAPEGLDAFTYCPWMVANLTVRRLPDGAAWDNVIADSPSLGYVVATHQDLRIAPGPSVLTYYLPLTAPNPAAAREWMLGREWRDWVSLILADLGQAHPDIESLVTHVDVMLWGHAMIRPVPGFVWGEARRGAAARHGAVRFAHSDMSGISVFEEAQYHGVRAEEGDARARPPVRELALISGPVRRTARTQGRARAVRRWHGGAARRGAGLLVRGAPGQEPAPQDVRRERSRAGADSARPSGRASSRLCRRDAHLLLQRGQRVGGGAGRRGGQRLVDVVVDAAPDVVELVVGLGERPPLPRPCASSSRASPPCRWRRRRRAAG